MHLLIQLITVYTKEKQDEKVILIIWVDDLICSQQYKCTEEYKYAQKSI